MLIKPHIIDVKVLTLLDAIKDETSYPIQYECENVYVPGVKWNKQVKQWYIAIPHDVPIEKFTRELWAHELMHIKLRLEGWPWYQSTGLRQPQTAVNSLLSSMEHIEIGPRLRKLGLVNPQKNLEEFQEVIERFPDGFLSLPQVQHVLVNCGPELSLTLFLFSWLVEQFPDSHTPSYEKDLILCRIRQVPYMVEAFEKTCQILALFGEPLTISKDEFHSKALDVLGIIEFHPECLQLAHE